LKGSTIIASLTKSPVRFLVSSVVCALLAASLSLSGVESARSAGFLRVCADPDNMPFSNNKGEGFENKLAELIAEKLGNQLDYAWFSESTGYVPNTMGREACDLVMGYAQGTGLIDDTNPYYYTSYVFIYRQDDQSLAGLERLSDLRLKGKKIGLFARTPPASLLAMYGLGGNAKPFEVNADESDFKTVQKMIAEIASGELDVGILWGPVGGYYAEQSSVPLKLVPLVNEKAGPSTVYPITMGVRPNEPQWKHTINKVLAENQAGIYAILESYNVPVLDENGKPVTAAAAER
jgi:mxaJ protein